MSSLEIMLNKETFKPGEKIDGNLFLKVEKKLKTKGLTVDIYGGEHTEITRSHYNAATKTTNISIYTEDVSIINQELNLLDYIRQYSLSRTEKKLVMMPGPYTIPFSFTLPKNATPSYDGSCADVSYKVSSRVDIPWGFDLKAKKWINVIHEIGEKKEGKTVRLHEKSGGILSPDVDMIVELSKKEFVRGENIEGKVAVTKQSGKKIKNILLNLYANEHAYAEGHTEDSTVMSYSLEIPVNQPELGYIEQNFQFLIPSDVVPTLHKNYFNIDWYFKVSLDISWAIDVKTETPIKIF